MDVHHEHASRAAEQVVNWLAADLPPSERFVRIRAAILAAMQAAKSELEEIRLSPSEN